MTASRPGLRFRHAAVECLGHKVACFNSKLHTTMLSALATGCRSWADSSLTSRTVPPCRGCCSICCCSMRSDFGATGSLHEPLQTRRFAPRLARVSLSIPAPFHACAGLPAAISTVDGLDFQTFIAGMTGTMALVVAPSSSGHQPAAAASAFTTAAAGLLTASCSTVATPASWFRGELVRG